MQLLVKKTLLLTGFSPSTPNIALEKQELLINNFRRHSTRLVVYESVYLSRGSRKARREAASTIQSPLPQFYENLRYLSFCTIRDHKELQL